MQVERTCLAVRGHRQLVVGKHRSAGDDEAYRLDRAASASRMICSAITTDSPGPGCPDTQA